METTWILVADRTGAKLFESKGPGKGALQHLRNIPHPEGRLQARDTEADKPGRSADSFGTRHAMSPHHEPQERHAQEFAAASHVLYRAATEFRSTGTRYW